MVNFLLGFLTSSLIFGSLAAWYFVRALRRVRLMQRYMKQDAANIVHAAARDIYSKKPTGNNQSVFDRTTTRNTPKEINPNDPEWKKTWDKFTPSK